MAATKLDIHIYSMFQLMSTRCPPSRFPHKHTQTNRNSYQHACQRQTEIAHTVLFPNYYKVPAGVTQRWRIPQCLVIIPLLVYSVMPKI